MVESSHIASPVDDGLGSVAKPSGIEVPALASLYIQPLNNTGSKLASATGFVVRNSAHQAFLVTNRHVVTGRNSKKNNELKEDPPSAILVHLYSAAKDIEWIAVAIDLGDEVGRPIWWEHPDYGWKVDVVAIPLPEYVEKETDLVSYQAAGQAVARLAITGELYVIGFPVGFKPFDTGAVLGVWVRGTIAWHPSMDWEGLPSTLIDCRSRPGQSGSPVVFYADDLTRFRAADGELRSGPQWDLVGIYSGRTSDDSDIGIVWKRSAIDDIVERGQRPDEQNPYVCPLDEGVDLQREAGIVVSACGLSSRLRESNESETS